MAVVYMCLYLWAHITLSAIELLSSYSNLTDGRFMLSVLSPTSSIRTFLLNEYTPHNCMHHKLKKLKSNHWWLSQQKVCVVEHQ